MLIAVSPKLMNKAASARVAFDHLIARELGKDADTELKATYKPLFAPPTPSNLDIIFNLWVSTVKADDPCNTTFVNCLIAKSKHSV